VSAADNRPAVVVLSSSWHSRDSELSFVTRAVAAAVSRCATVTVATPTEAGMTEPDGAFDPVGIGVGRQARWPEPDAARWTEQPDPAAIWILDEPSGEARAILDAFGGAGTTFSISPVPPEAGPSLRQLPLTPGADPKASEVVGMHVPINPLAGTHRHAGLGFTGYVLVLSDRPNGPAVQPPTPAVAWLTSRFHDAYIVVVEGGNAAAWKGRALRGVVGVDTRTDLWRLLAHASVTVDLAPGPIIGRECIESLLLGTPIVVPEDSAAAAHAHAGGGMAYASIPDLLDAVETLTDEEAGAPVAARGRRYAEEYYGDAGRFVERSARVLGLSAS
jgi:hypothetical protein